MIDLDREPLPFLTPVHPASTLDIDTPLGWWVSLLSAWFLSTIRY
jgi:hypothetical protein